MLDNAPVDPDLPVMDLLSDIDQEHRVIEKLAGSMVNITRTLATNDDPQLQNDLKTVWEFLTKFMIEHHAVKEENLIFKTLENTGIPGDKGPLHFYKLEHNNHTESALKLNGFLQKTDLSESERNELKATAELFCADLWEHLDKEDSVLLTEFQERIKGKALLDLKEQYQSFMEKNPIDQDLFKKVRQLIEKYPPVELLPDVFRGDGCMSCRYYGDGCQGIEHEWWSEHEWEDFFERNNRD